MTTVSSIISDAFRLTNLTAVGKSPTTDQQTEALRHLNRIVKSVFGYEVGEELVTLPIGRNNISQPSDWPGYNTTPDSNWIVPKNVRLQFNLAEPVQLYLHPAPDDGSRFSVVDASGNLATYNVTFNGNGSRIEGASTLVLNTNSITGDWFYRADQGNWVKLSPLLIDDTFPFPEEFDDFFIMLLAMRLNPSYGKALAPEAQELFNRSRSMFRARYAQYIPVMSDLGLIRLSKMSAESVAWGGSMWDYNPEVMFNRGRPY